MDNDLISRAALYKAWDALDEKQDPNLLIDAMIRETQDAPAVDAEPVRHGRWLKLAYDPAWTKCSECRCNWEWGMVENCNMIYCPNCGAKMMENRDV